MVSPPNDGAAQGAAAASTKRQRNSSPPAARPKSARAATRAASTALKAQSPPLSSAAPVAVPHVSPVATHAVPPVMTPAPARDVLAQALNQTAEQSGAAPMPVLDMWQTAKPDGSAPLSAPTTVDPSASTALRDVGAAVAASTDQQQTVACMNLPSTLIAMIRGAAPATSDVTAQLPLPLPESSKATLTALATGSAAGGAPSAFSAHQPFSQLVPPQSGNGAFTQNVGLPILPIEQLCNVNGPSQGAGPSLLAPGVLNPAAVGHQSPPDGKAVHAVPALGTMSLPAALDCPVASCPPGDSNAAGATAICSKLEAAEPLTHPDAAGTPGTKPEKMAHKVSSINSLNHGVSMDTSAREADTSQNVTEGSILANGSEFTSRVATSDAPLFSAERRPHASVSSLPVRMPDGTTTVYEDMYGICDTLHSFVFDRCGSQTPPLCLAYSD